MAIGVGAQARVRGLAARWPEGVAVCVAPKGAEGAARRT